MAWYDATFVQTGRSPALWALVGFLVTFALVRTITRRIHARQAARAEGSGPVKDVFIGGVHVHHQVWGILLVLVSGLLTFRFRPESPWIDVLALVFGAGAALTLDEFALWFHLDDVYWSTEGRKSIDAILVGRCPGRRDPARGLPHRQHQRARTRPRGCTRSSSRRTWRSPWSASSRASSRRGSWASSCRRSPGSAPRDWRSPGSYWARRRYRGKKLERARRRFGPAYQARRDRLRDLLGGTPRRRPRRAPPVDR